MIRITLKPQDIIDLLPIAAHRIGWSRLTGKAGHCCPIAALYYEIFDLPWTGATCADIMPFIHALRRDGVEAGFAARTIEVTADGEGDSSLLDAMRQTCA